MQVSVETLSDLERRITVQVPAEKVDREIHDRLLSLSRQVKVDGFRPGKAPLKVIKRLYGERVRYEAVNELMKDSLHAALVQERLSPLGGPMIEPKNLEEGHDLEYCATFEVMPEFEPTGFETITVERPTADVTEQDIDSMIENLRQQRTVWNAVERPSRESDRIRIDFQGRIENQEFAGGKGENTVVVLGKQTMLKDFEDRLIGLSAGTETEFDVFFPENYHVKEIAGKTAHFQVKLHVVEEGVLPEVDDAFAESFDIREGGIAGLRKSLREHMEHELGDSIKTLVKRQVMQGLLAANPIALPRALVAMEIENLARQMNFPEERRDEKAQHLKVRLFGLEARRRVALGLLISELAARQNIKVDEKQVQDYLQSMVSSYENPEEAIRWYEKTPHALDSLRALVLEDQIMEWVLKRAQVTEKSSTFAEIMTPGQHPANPPDQELLEAHMTTSFQPAQEPSE